MNDVVVQPLSFESLLDGPAADVPALPADMSLVEHVAVKLTAVLGQAEITVGDLFRLSQGTVLPLREYLDEPIVLKLDGRAVATANLVAVGDHFGVRIAEIL